MPYNFDKIIDRRSTNSIKWTRYPKDVLPMWVADMDFYTPQPIRDALQATIENGVLGYELPSQILKEAVVARMQKLYDWHIEPEMVVAVPGIVSGFNAAAGTVCASGEGVLMQPPVYFPFLKVHQNKGLTRQDAPLISKTNGNKVQYKIDFEKFEKVIVDAGVRTSMFLFCNPHNPTGNAFSEQDLSKLAEICLRHQVIICSDEIHSELLLGETKHIPIAALSKEIEEQTITLIAPSKTFNTAGLFCGFAIIPNQNLRERYIKVTEQMTFHVTNLGQVAAQTAFSGVCDDWLADVRSYMTANRDFIVDHLKENIPEICMTVPEATYLMWLDCNPLIELGIISENPYEFFLSEAKVAVNNGADFGPGGEGFIRLNFACPRSSLEEALSRMQQSIVSK